MRQGRPGVSKRPGTTAAGCATVPDEAGTTTAGCTSVSDEAGTATTGCTPVSDEAGTATTGCTPVSDETSAATGGSTTATGCTSVSDEAGAAPAWPGSASSTATSRSTSRPAPQPVTPASTSTASPAAAGYAASATAGCTPSTACPGHHVQITGTIKSRANGRRTTAGWQDGLTGLILPIYLMAGVGERIAGLPAQCELAKQNRVQSEDDRHGEPAGDAGALHTGKTPHNVPAAGEQKQRNARDGQGKAEHRLR